MIAEPPRNLTDEERTLLAWLANSVDESRPGYASQVDTAKVVGHCECGCGSISLGVFGCPTVRPGRRGLLTSYCGHTRDGRYFDVILFARDGYLDYLEIVTYDDQGAIPIPEPSMLDVGDPFSA